MIIVKLRGRLGNQLFQYALGRLMAKRYNTTFMIDSSGQKFNLEYFNLCQNIGLLSNNILEKINNKAVKLLSLKMPKVVMEDVTLTVDQSKLLDNRKYLGYFQEYDLYNEVRSELIKDFSIKNKYIREFNERFKKSFYSKKTLTVSFRLGDYKGFTFFIKDGILPFIPFYWYEQVLSQFDLDEYAVYFMSDDIDFVEKYFSVRHPNITYVRAGVATQLHMMANANVCVISNSTFAWWGAYLNNIGGRIICPQYFLGFMMGENVPPNIYPNHWEQVEVPLLDIRNDITQKLLA
jgi:hypothetical protein